MAYQLEENFSDLPWLIWAKALEHLQPVLYLREGTICLGPLDLARLKALLTTGEDLFETDPLVFGSEAHYLARRLDNYAHEAVNALQEVEANPGLYGEAVYNLLTSLVGGNSIVTQVLFTTEPDRSHERYNNPSLVESQPGSSTINARVADLARTRWRIQYPKIPHLLEPKNG